MPSPVGTVSFDNLAVHCTDHNGTASGTARGGAIHNHKFKGVTHHAGPATVVIAGTFSHNYRTVSGTIHDTGTLSGHPGCDSGRAHWTATR